MPASRILCPYQISGPIDILSLENAVWKVIERHEVLSERLAWSDGMLWLEEGDRPQLEVTAYHNGEPASDVALRLGGKAGSGDEGCYARFKLALDGEASQSVFVLSIDHRIADAYSLSIILAEISDFYAQPDLEIPHPKQFREWAADQREIIRRDKAAAAWWRSACSGTGGTHRTPAFPAGGGGVIEVPLPGNLASGISSIPARFHTTPFCLVLAAMSMALTKVDHDMRILMTTNYSHRDRPQASEVVGCLTSRTIIPLEARRIAASRPAATVINEVTEQVWHALDHTIGPFSWILQCAGISNDDIRCGWPYVAIDQSLESALRLDGCDITQIKFKPPPLNYHSLRIMPGTAGWKGQLQGPGGIQDLADLWQDIVGNLHWLIGSAR